TYLFGDECEGQIHGLRRAADGTVTAEDLGLHVNGLSTFGEDADGELYAAGIGDGQISRVDAVPAETTTTSTTLGAAPAPPTTTTAAAALSADPAVAADQLAAA